MAFGKYVDNAIKKWMVFVVGGLLKVVCKEILRTDSCESRNDWRHLPLNPLKGTFPLSLLSVVL